MEAVKTVKSLVRLSAIALLSLSVAGCIIVDGEHVSHDSWSDNQRENREAISQLQINMPSNDVIRQLGPPDASEAFTLQGEEIRVLFYRTQRKHADGETTRDETTPLVFRDDLLSGWGDAVYAQLRH